MCDIFGRNCAHDDCEEGIPFHISDYCLPRSIIKRAFCENHKPTDFKDAHDYSVGKYMGFYRWNDRREFVAFVEIDWEIFVIAVKSMLEDNDLYGLSHLLYRRAPIELNTAEDFQIAWG